MRKVDPVKHEGKRLEILAAAESCFIAKGFHRASMAEICDAAGISPGHLYHYFASKEGIIVAIAQFRMESAATALASMLQEPDPFATFLQRAGRIAPAMQATSMLLEMLAEAGRNQEVATIIQKQSKAIRNLFGDILRKGQADGRADAHLDPDLAASILMSILVDGMKTLTIREPDIDLKRAGDMVRLLVSRFLASS